MSAFKYWLSVILPTKKPVVTKGFWMTQRELESELRLHASYASIPFGYLDSDYYYVTHEDWGKVFADCFIGMPGYLAERLDCDDFAWIFRGRVVERYGINAIGFVVGPTDMGYHGFCIFRSEHGLFLLEPNPKFGYGDFNILEVGERGYRPEKVLI